MCAQIIDPVPWNDVSREWRTGQRIPDWDELTVHIEAVGKISNPLRCRRRVRKYRAPILFLSRELLGPKEEQFTPVAVELLGNKHWAAERITVDPVSIRRFRRVCPVVEEVIRIQVFVPVEVVGASVELLRPGFRNHRDHST